MPAAGAGPGASGPRRLEAAWPAHKSPGADRAPSHRMDGAAAGPSCHKGFPIRARGSFPVGRGRPCLGRSRPDGITPDAAERRLPYGRASMTMLNGVSAALRTLRKPPCLMAPETRANPACAPRAAPTGWSSEVGTQTMVEAA